MPSAGANILETILRTIEAMPPLLGFMVLFAGTVIEYVFPPFPGDTVVVAGAALVAAFDWPLWPVFTAVTAGSVAGSTVAWAVGRAVARREKVRAGDGDPALHGRAHRAVHRLVAGFERHGPWYLVLNRFMPGVRTFFFVAAGMVDLPLRVVLFWSSISAAAWNAALIWLGLKLGDNIETLDVMVSRYNRLVMPLVIGVVMVAVWRSWRAVRENGKAS